MRSLSTNMKLSVLYTNMDIKQSAQDSKWYTVYCKSTKFGLHASLASQQD